MPYLFRHLAVGLPLLASITILGVKAIFDLPSVKMTIWHS
jgi:hypothetical protein